MKMKVEIFRYIFTIFVCVSITKAFGYSASKLDFLEESIDSENSLGTKQELRQNYDSNNLSNEDFNEQENIILSLENWKESEEPQLITKIERQKEIDSYEQLENVSENEDNKNLRNVTKASFFEENLNIAEDASKMIALIGSLEDIVENPINNFPFEKIGKGEMTMISKNRNFQNEIELNKILTKVDKMKKNVFPARKNESSFVNRIDVNIAVDASGMKNVVQTLTMTKNTKKVINPHLGEKKSFFKYKQTLESSKLSLNKTTSK